MKPMPLPAVVGALFLARDGLLGLRCHCGHLVTARTPHAVEWGFREHTRFSHLPAEQVLMHDGGQE